MSIDRKQCPQFLNDYITYLKVVKGCSERTVEEYFLDIRLFLRYIKKERLNLKENVSNIPIKDFDSEWLKEVTLNEIYDFEYFLSQERRNSNTARSRKTSALKNFFNYLQKRAGIIDKNPALVFESKFQDDGSKITAVDGAQFEFEPEYYAIAVPKGDTALVDAINKAIEELKADGTFDELVKTYIEE